MKQRGAEVRGRGGGGGYGDISQRGVDPDPIIGLNLVQHVAPQHSGEYSEHAQAQQKSGVDVLIKAPHSSLSGRS